jgi:protein-tyrosine-phosphatase
VCGVRIAVACRQNKARSPFAELVIRHHFPESLVTSFGTEVTDGEETSDFAALTAQRWGLSPMKERTTSTEKFIHGRFSPQLLIAADQLVLDALHDAPIACERRSLTDELIHPELRPSDPDGMEESHFERELAKVSNTVMRTIYEWKGVKNKNQIFAFIPRGTTDISQTIAHAVFEANAMGATIIDGDCRAPHGIDLQEQNLTPIDFDYTLSMQNTFPILKENQVLRHCRELDKPEKYFLSQSWKGLVDFYAKTRPVVIITSPRRSKSRTLSDSFLSSYFADSISVISS